MISVLLLFLCVSSLLKNPGIVKGRTYARSPAGGDPLRIGYACQTVAMPGTVIRRCALKNASPGRLLSLVSQNLTSLENMLTTTFITASGSIASVRTDPFGSGAAATLPGSSCFPTGCPRSAKRSPLRHARFHASGQVHGAQLARRGRGAPRRYGPCVSRARARRARAGRRTQNSFCTSAEIRRAACGCAALPPALPRSRRRDPAAARSGKNDGQIYPFRRCSILLCRPARRSFTTTC